MLRLLAILLLSQSWLSAQIFADFTVSYDGQTLGTFEVTLEPVRAPRTTANFIGLATGERPWIDLTTGEIKNTPFYDGLTFHRLIHNFVIQGGSPNGNGDDNPGFAIQDEFHPDLRHDGAYVLSMAKSTFPASGGAQFFITLAATPFLDDKHSIFGTVTGGRSIIDGFMNEADFPTTPSPKDSPPPNNMPIIPIVIEKVEIRGYDPNTFNINDSALRLPHVKSQPTFETSLQQNVFRLGYDRDFQTEYFVFSSSELQSWRSLGRVLSSDAAADDILTITVVRDQGFFRVPRVDYQNLVNAPSDFNAAGTTIVLSNRNGDTVTLNLTGGSGGTWSDSNNNSGTLSNVQAADFIGPVGVQVSQARLAELPLVRLVADFDSPAGAEAWESFNFVFSFHEGSTGFVDGGAVRTIPGEDAEPDTTATIPVLWQFSYQP